MDRLMLSRKAYPTDLTDAEWQYLQPLIPAGKTDQGGRGRKRQVDIREVLSAIFYLMDSGCKWNQLPDDLPPRSTVFSYFSKWQKMNDKLREQVRFAWLGNYRRLSKDYETWAESHESMVYGAMIRLMLRRLVKPLDFLCE